MKIDLNCDAGEGFGAYSFGMDEALFSHVSSVNIACGMHAGDPVTMRKTVQLAKKHGLAIGAHPGLDDRAGFGRRWTDRTPDEVYALVLAQLGSLQAFVGEQSASLHHVKAHGALYHKIHEERVYAEAFVEAVKSFRDDLLIYGQPTGVLREVVVAAGLRFASEGFMDRCYEEDGTLVSRLKSGAVLEDPQVALQQALQMIERGTVTASNDKVISMPVDTLCVHADTCEALNFISAVTKALTERGISLERI